MLPTPNNGKGFIVKEEAAKCVTTAVNIAV